MKKHLLLLLLTAVFTFASCSSDDDETSRTNIEATWTLAAVEPSIPIFDFSACPSNPTITFNEDNTTEWTFYNAENDCEPETDEGSWKQNSESSYTVTIPDYGSFNGTVAFQNSDEFTFSTDYEGFPIVLYFEK